MAFSREHDKSLYENPDMVFINGQWGGFYFENPKAIWFILSKNRTSGDG